MLTSYRQFMLSEAKSNEYGGVTIIKAVKHKLTEYIL